MISNWRMQYTIKKIFLKVIRYFPFMFQITCFEKDMSIQSFGTTKVSILGLPPGSLKEKCHLDVAFVKSHRIYY